MNHFQNDCNNDRNVFLPGLFLKEKATVPEKFLCPASNNVDRSHVRKATDPD
jgi:hypothetical protein